MMTSNLRGLQTVFQDPAVINCSAFLHQISTFIVLKHVLFWLANSNKRSIASRFVSGVSLFY